MYPKAEVVLYHDVLGERLLSYLLNNTNRDYLVSATTSGADPDVRLSAVSWVHLNRSPTTVRILKMVNSLTGLNAVNPLATAIQLASYPPGGHYTAHADAVSQSTSPSLCTCAHQRILQVGFKSVLRMTIS